MSEKLAARVSSLLYHEVTDDPATTGFQRKAALPYKHAITEFDQNLARIAQSPIAVSLVDQIDFDTPNQHLLLTFDDGGKSAMHIADAIEKQNWRGHFYITTSLIDTATFLSARQIKDLHARGHIIGTHTHTHPHVFYNLRYQQMLEEWQRSLEILKDLLQAPITTASIPGGEMNFETQLSAQAAGIRFLFTSEPKLTPWKLDTLICLGRVCPKTGTSLDKVSRFAQHRGFGRELAVREIKNTIKKVYYPLRTMLGFKS